jgi:sigma-B regulation protein RsbU (phosphoserine phosphatase)
VALCIADVTGQGMPAALLMSNLQAMVRALAPGAAGPAELCVRLNRSLAAQIAPGRFITLLFGVLHLTRRTLTYVNAGHNPPVLLRAAGAHEWLDVGGPLLAVVPEAPYEQAEVALATGDRLVLYTDGITEAMDATRDLFGEERLLATIRAAAAADAATLQASLLATVTAFCRGEFQDDATVITVALD